MAGSIALPARANSCLMKRPIRVSAEELTRELSRLGDEGRDSLARRWTDLYGAAPPPRTSRSLMVRAVAYRMQEQVYGGLPAPIRRMLVDGAESGSPRRPARQAKPGTVLLREWRGKMHRVTIEEGGVLYRGGRYRSLSEVARIITGCRWSGPAFFGLKKRGQR
jgi:hypothetical protein